MAEHHNSGLTDGNAEEQARQEAVPATPTTPEHFSQADDQQTAPTGRIATLRDHLRPQEPYAIIGGFGLFVLVLMAIVNPAYVNPIFPLAALIFFLYPFRKGIVPRRVIQLGLAVVIGWLLLNLAGVLFPFIISFIFAYLCAPLVSHLASRGIPRWLTSLTVVLVIVGLYSLVGFLVIPNVVNEFDGIIASAQSLLQGANSLLDTERLVAWLSEYGVPPEQAREIITQHVEPQVQAFVSWLLGWLTQFLQNLTSILEGLANLILIPFLSFFMTVDFDKIRSFVRKVILQNKTGYIYYLKRVDTILNSYIRGILLTSSMVGAAATGILSIFSVPYAIAIGIMTGVFNLIPSLGMFITLFVAMIIYAFVPGNFWFNTLVTAGMIAGLHALNAYVVEPRIIGNRVGLHPVVLIASLFIFAHFLGFIGLLIAVPTTAVLVMFIKEWYGRTVSHQCPAIMHGSD